MSDFAPILCGGSEVPINARVGVQQRKRELRT